MLPTQNTSAVQQNTLELKRVLGKERKERWEILEQIFQKKLEQHYGSSTKLPEAAPSRREEQADSRKRKETNLEDSDIALKKRKEGKTEQEENGHPSHSYGSELKHKDAHQAISYNPGLPTVISSTALADARAHFEKAGR